MIVALSVIAFAEVFRGVRYCNILFGLILIAAPLIISGTSVIANGNNLLVGCLIVIFARSKGKISERYGLIDQWIV